MTIIEDILDEDNNDEKRRITRPVKEILDEYEDKDDDRMWIYWRKTPVKDVLDPLLQFSLLPSNRVSRTDLRGKIMMIGTFFMRIMTNEDDADEVENAYSDDVIKYLN